MMHHCKCWSCKGQTSGRVLTSDWPVSVSCTCLSVAAFTYSFAGTHLSVPPPQKRLMQDAEPLQVQTADRRPSLRNRHSLSFLTASPVATARARQLHGALDTDQPEGVSDDEHVLAEDVSVRPDTHARVQSCA